MDKEQEKLEQAYSTLWEYIKGDPITETVAMGKQVPKHVYTTLHWLGKQIKKEAD